jgi:hypothetical protein
VGFCLAYRLRSGAERASAGKACAATTTAAAGDVRERSGLRPDGSYLVRDQLGASEFYDFGRWKYSDGTLELAGGRDARRYPLKGLRKAPQVEPLRGPFRMVGLYDGATFKECRTGLAWPLAQTRAADALHTEYVKRTEKLVLVALDAQFEGEPEMLRVFRPASVLDARSCPS